LEVGYVELVGFEVGVEFSFLGGEVFERFGFEIDGESGGGFEEIKVRSVGAFFVEVESGEP